MSRVNLIISSVAGGVVIAVVLTAMAFSVGNRKVSGVLLWQNTLFVYLVGPEPLLYTDAQGKPHDAKSINMLIFLVEFLFSVAIYSVPSYFFLRWLARGRRSQPEHAP